MEVAPGRSGGGSVSDVDLTERAAARLGGTVTEGDPERSQKRLNVVLYAMVLACAGAVALAGTVMWQQHKSDGGDTSGGVASHAWSVLVDRRAEGGNTRAGDKVGSKIITAVPAGSTSEQERVALALESATKMVNAFLNVRYTDVDATVEAVLSMAAGNFKDQYTKSTKGIRATARRAQSVAKSDVVWAGYVTGDDDSATVLLAATGTVENKQTDKPQARTYRVQVELILQDGRWLTRDLQFVA